jgi:serine protease Do
MLVASAAALALAVASGVVIGFVWGGGGPAAVAEPKSDDKLSITTAPSTAPAPVLMGGIQLPSLANIVERVSPAVVSLEAKVSPDAPTARGGEEGEDELDQLPPNLRDLFERFRRGAPNQRRPRGEVQGSGFVVDPNGYIVTNNHVVQNATDIQVTFSDGKKYKAKLIGRDEPTDIALIKVDGAKFPSVVFADDSKVRVGDWVLAVGNPFGLGGTVTAGIVSARGRDEVAGAQFTDYLQIDAAINRGNSGGPTFDLNGRVIGVNTLIFSPSGGSVGIGFAIPSNTVRRVIEELKRAGSVTRGWLGVQIQSLSDDAAQALGLPNAQGAIVAEIIDGSPAAKAGVRQGDVILNMNGTVIKDNRDLSRKVAALQVGQAASFTVWRDNRRQTINVTIAKRPGEDRLARNDRSDDKSDRGGSSSSGEAKVAALGLDLATITPAVRREFDLDASTKGVLITEVDPESDAAERGIRPGDRIIAVAGTEVRGVSDVKSAVDTAKSQSRPSVLLFVETARGGKVYVPVKLKK